MILGHKIKEIVNVKEFITNVKCYNFENIQCTPHTFFRLSEKQKEIFKCETLKEYLTEKIPVFVGIQYNGNYSAFYKYSKQRFIRIIIGMKTNGIDIVTFYVIEKNQLPKVRK